MTRGPAPRVAAQLALLRDVVDEIIVAVDDRAEAEVVGALGTVADRIVLFPYAEPVDRPLAWLHAECSEEWVLTIDDDELPSAELIDALPELQRDERVTHYRLPRRWLYPDAEHVLDAHPWRSDYLLRLVRNDPRLLRFPVESHWPIEVLGPSRYLHCPLYHLDCLLSPLELRERKARRYEELRPGKRTAGLPLNRAFYLPERVPGVATVAVPERDVELIRGVLTAERPPDAPLRPERVSRAEIDRHWEGREFGDTAYRARLELLEEPALSAGESRTLDVLVHNLGDEVWPWGDAAPEIRLAARWPNTPGAEELRTQLPADVPPGETVLVPAQVAAPRRPGSHRLELDLVHEQVRWFGCGVTCEVHVKRQPRIVLAANDVRFVRSWVQRLAEEEPELEPVVLARDPAGLCRSVDSETVESAHRFLLAGLPRSRVLAGLVLLGRAASLAWRAPGTAPQFVQALDGAERLVLHLPGDDVPLRQLAVDVVTARTARRQGVSVVVESASPPSRLAARLLLALARRP